MLIYQLVYDDGYTTHTMSYTKDFVGAMATIGELNKRTEVNAFKIYTIKVHKTIEDPEEYANLLYDHFVGGGH